MKYLLDRLTHVATRMDPLAKPGDALSILFSVLGNGYNLDNCGYIQQTERDSPAVEFGDPEPINWIYPFSKERKYQPFYMLRGCRNHGYKEAFQYFIKCLEISDSSNEDIAEWQKNIDLLYKALNAPLFKSLKIDKNDIGSFLKMIENDKRTYQSPRDGTQLPKKESVYKTWFFDVQWSDCPLSIQDEVRILWDRHNVGNDVYCIKQTLTDHFFEYYPLTYMWLKHKGVSEGEKFVIHWWW